jgi:hypothetical protein
MRKILTMLAALPLILACGVATAGETTVYRGTGHYVSTQVLLPLASGGAAIHLSNDTVATIEPSEIGFIFGECAGLGYTSAEGEFSSNAYCTFSENE